MPTTITIAKPVVPQIESCNLELTGEELATLYTILQLIGGNPKETRRRYADSIRLKLEAACKAVNLDTEYLNYKHEVSKANCSIYFDKM